MRKFYVRIKLIIPFFLIVGKSIGQVTPTVNDFYELNKNFRKGEGFSNFDNLNGNLAWGESYLLMSYLNIYEIHQDLDFLMMIGNRCFNLFDKSDLSLERKDYNGIIRPLWSSTRYSKNQVPAAWVVHTGMITYPILRFCEIVLSNNDLQSKVGIRHETLGEDAYFLLKFAENSINSHRQEWNREKYNYFFPKDFPLKDGFLKGDVLPFNMFAAIGRSYLVLYSLTKNQEYKEKVVYLAEGFKNNLDHKQDSYIWKYHPSVNRYEDIGHGHIEVHFAYLCYKENLVFGIEDMNKFANTFTNFIHQGNGIFINYVYSATPNKHLLKSPDGVVGSWVFLNEFNPEIIKIVSPIVYNRVNSEEKITNARILFGFSEVLKFHK